MRFVAIDFETANEKRNSPCALGISVFEGANLIEEKYWLIKPQENRFEPMNIWVHGITEKDVENEREFHEIWNEIYPYLQGNLVVAHNASFDVSVLRNTLDSYGIEYPEFPYICTVVASKNFYDGVENYKLNTLARALGIKFQHHHAGEDATAAGKIFADICNELDIKEIDDIEKKVFVRLGRVFKDGYKPCGKSKSIQNGLEIKRKFIQGEIIRAKIGSLKDANIVFTGGLSAFSRAEAMKIVRSAGGIAAGTVSKKTNYLVASGKMRAGLEEGRKSTKYRKAEKLMSQGQDLRIITEEEFLQMIK